MSLWLFDVLDLLPELLDFHLNFDGGLADADAEFVESGSFGQHRADLAVHFLKNEIHTLARFFLKFLETVELIEMTLQAGRFFSDVAPLGIEQRFSFQPVTAVGDELRRQFRNTSDELLAIVFNEVFRMGQDGKLAFIRNYDIDVGQVTQWWTGMIPLA